MNRVLTTLAVLGLVIPTMAFAADQGGRGGRFGGERGAQAQVQRGGGDFGNRGGFGGRNFQRGQAAAPGATPQQRNFGNRGDFGNRGNLPQSFQQVAPGTAPQGDFANRRFGGRTNVQTAPGARPELNRRDFGNRFDNRNFGNRNFDNRNFGNRNFDNRFRDRNFGNNFRNRPNFGSFRRPGDRFFSYRGRFFPQIARPFRYPAGFAYRRWAIGAFLPPLFLSSQFFFDDFFDVGLPPPPPGTRWIQYGPDALLVDIFTGEVIDVAYGVFY